MTKELLQFPLFFSCTEAMLQELLALPYRRKEYKAGEMVVRVGDTCDWLMLLAEMLGVARPSLSRIIADLLDEGVLERTEKGIVIRK